MTVVLLTLPFVEPIDEGELPPQPLINPSLWVASGPGTVQINQLDGSIELTSPGTQTKVTYAYQTKADHTYLWTYRAFSGTGQRAVGTGPSVADVVGAVTTNSPALVQTNFTGTGQIVYLQLFRTSVGQFFVTDLTLEEFEPAVFKDYMTDEDGNRLTDEAGNYLWVEGTGQVVAKTYLTDNEFNILTDDSGARLYVDG